MKAVLRSVSCAEKERNCFHELCRGSDNQKHSGDTDYGNKLESGKVKPTLDWWVKDEFADTKTGLRRIGTCEPDLMVLAGGGTRWSNPKI